MTGSVRRLMLVAVAFVCLAMAQQLRAATVAAAAVADDEGIVCSVGCALGVGACCYYFPASLCDDCAKGYKSCKAACEFFMATVFG